MSPCMLVQLFKLLSTEGVRQLSSRSGRKINTIILPLKKKVLALYDPVPVVPVAGGKQ